MGSTKVLPHRWARRLLPDSVFYVGSHPIAGSEQHGIEFARDDLFNGSVCILTKTAGSSAPAAALLRKFWLSLGCQVKSMTPSMHDRVFGSVSHLPHLLAAALMNASPRDGLRFAGRGFMDTTRIASGPARIWADVLLANSVNSIRGIKRIMTELDRFDSAIARNDRNRILNLLEKARRKRSSLVNYRIKNREIIS